LLRRCRIVELGDVRMCERCIVEHDIIHKPTKAFGIEDALANHRVTHCTIGHICLRCNWHPIDVQRHATRSCVVATRDVVPGACHRSAGLDTLIGNPTEDALIVGKADFHTCGITGTMPDDYHRIVACAGIYPCRNGKSTCARPGFTKAESAFTVHFNGVRIVVA